MPELIYLIPILFIAGLAGGYLSGLLGIGGGMIYVFILTILFKENYQLGNEIGHFVIANSLFVIFLSTLVSTLRLREKKLFYPKEVLKIGIPSLFTSLAITYFLVNTPMFSPLVFDSITLIVLIYILLATLLKLNKGDDSTLPDAISTTTYFLSGISAGILSAITGLGGGTILNPILNGKFNLKMTVSRSISLGVIMVSSFSISVLNLVLTPKASLPYSIGYIQLPYCVVLGIGAMLSCKYGVQMGNKLSAPKLLVLFSIFVALLIIKKIGEIY
ncbi:MAG: sulfite exporter TauE/SafE family protein [Cyclobacteriaceae bacterium]